MHKKSSPCAGRYTVKHESTPCPGLTFPVPCPRSTAKARGFAAGRRCLCVFTLVYALYPVLGM